MIIKTKPPEECPPHIDGPARYGGCDIARAKERRAYLVKWRRAGHTFKSIAEAMGISQPRVAQIYKSETKNGR